MAISTQLTELRNGVRSAGTSEQGDERPVDLIHLSRQTGGDRDLEREVLAMFLSQCHQAVEAIAHADGERARRENAHRLKGCARAIGAWRVAVEAERVEAGETSDDLAALRKASQTTCDYICGINAA